MDRNLAVAVASCGTVDVSGTFYRHASLNTRELTGSAAGGRWGPPGAYAVFYLGRPPESVVIEAHRHLLEEGMTPDMVGPRELLTVEVALTRVLDLRSVENQKIVDLNSDDLYTPVGEYARCLRVGRAAHQLGLHGIIAPAATLVGETLAIFERHLLPTELPRLVDREVWASLPDDPRSRLTSDAPDTLHREQD